MNAIDKSLSSSTVSGAFADEIADLFGELGLSLSGDLGSDLPVFSPIDGSALATLKMHRAADMDAMVANAGAAFLAWKRVPAPHRGELVRRYGQLVRDHKEALSRLLTIENGKILTEARGEVQEVIDICEYAVGLSRQLFGLTIASERAEHRLTEYWHPLGPLGLISAFNFPAAVWAWGTTVALVCGNSAIWKPSEKTPLTALAFAKLLQKAAAEYEFAPDHLVQIAIGDAECGGIIADHPGVSMVSATGSVRMGQDVGVRVQRRFGRSVLELGGNNAAIIAPSADIGLALRGTIFAATGTCGQRCTTLRRLIVHEDIRADFVKRLIAAVGSLNIGSPLDDATHVGPLIDKVAFDAMQRALEQARSQGGTVHGGDRIDVAGSPDAYYVRPAIVEMPAQSEIVREETFAPILYVLSYKDFAEAIALQNGVPQGLSSCVFTSDVREAETFQSAQGSDCGIVNVNIGTSGAEIGGAFGGEKVTGGGRVSGSDSWKNYMRRVTATVNYSTSLPLAQGVKFDLDID
ncbi:aldehyde dehydrogenase (NAD+) [Sphingopyxis sp. YR583]|jgi:aldehyde dehydrogenase (NAD+)|uniref:L-piperidine-6-carboxylate dehydrogenase n=1 Tax=Sphingopyxis sp. YR583 TaxID=1881047 RepID=UPI0008A77F49|nr:aldehyde dehydrogenase family protein [Sphingopyxis sp. YR583]SEH19666.1 aldehyde dehydrogenase (NAD+) [Sphingopyxis sp. YR583]